MAFWLMPGRDLHIGKVWCHKQSWVCALEEGAAELHWTQQAHAKQQQAYAPGHDHGTQSEDQGLQRGGGIHLLKWEKNTFTKRLANMIRRHLNC